MGHVVAVDIGGTFTDMVAFDKRTNSISYTKSPTSYGNFVDGVFDCLRKSKIAPREIDLINHGTTLVINSLIQRRGAKTALVTTRGFRDVLEIARGNRPDPFDLYYQREEPLIPRDARYEVTERIGSNGEVICALDEAELRSLVARLRNDGIEALAIFFMNSYVNPSHEERAAEIAREMLPDVLVTTSASLSREWYEYERASTVAANAFVGPGTARYIDRLEGELGAQGYDGSVFMMGSNGGVLSTERSAQQSIVLVESGPIGGCIGASVYAEALGYRNLIAFDMGGTTAKCALVEEGRFSVDSIYYVGGYVRGFPIKSPVINIVEVGSGGGSIAWLDSQMRLNVGPQSAGSTPGPVCYLRGGTEPTVTDANVILGRISATNFLGGELMLDRSAAERAIRERIAAPLGLYEADALYRMADGIASIATVIMAGAIRRISVEHGRDPRDFILFSYGGGGPLHSSALARELSIPKVVIPPEPGNFSAIGMLLADARFDDSKTFTGLLDDALLPAIEQTFAELERGAADLLKAEFGDAEVRFERFAEMRYRGQRHNIKVSITGLADAAAIRRAFEQDYQRRYGHADLKAAAELQSLHSSAFARLNHPDIGSLAHPLTGQMRKQSRKVYFAEAGHVEAAVYDRYRLPPGFAGIGPAVIEEYGSTTLVWPGDRFEIGALHEIVITIAA
jgi:N-methylhydantoinase A